KARLDRELDVIESKGFASYFLIVWDFCNFAHENGIPVGARGSGVGTLVGYCLGLCNVDPIKYDLLFERFMDPERNEMPDIDIDICQANRQRVIEYVRNKYGHVAQIITYGTMKARAVIRDICRVMRVPLSEADRLAKLVPETLGITLDKAIKTEPELKDAYEANELTRRVIDICKKLEGLARHASVHAAGVVIAEQPLTNYVPLYQPAGTSDIVTQFDGPTVEKVGLLKMDFLGLKTLSVLELAKKHVKELHGKDIDLEKLDYADPKVFEIFAKGLTKGVFQFESGGMADLLMKMRPDRIEDLIAANALYRPGPMTLIPDYIARKHGEKWDVPHDIMREVLAETFGIMIYQEQVMRICNRLGDIPLREAYAMIKAISKKKLKVIAKGREQFIEGCGKKGLKKENAEEVFELIERFAGYGFNKSHSTRYAFIAYQTAYMKAHYPVEFMAALLTYDMGVTDKVVDYIGECRSMGIDVLPPDVNESSVVFTPIYKRHGDEKIGVIRFGLSAVKGVGEKAVEQIIEAQKKIGKFESLFHFCENVDVRAANKQTMEALIKAGAFDRLGGNRAQMMAGLEAAMQNGSEIQVDRNNGQMNFFGSAAAVDYSKDHQKLPAIEPWPEAQMLAFEKQVLGFYVTHNPLSHHAEEISAYSTTDSSRLAECGQDKEITIGGMITKIRYHITKNGRNAGSKMAVFVLEDLQGSAEAVLFPKTLNNFADLLVEDKIVFVKGKVDTKREKPNIFVEDLIPIDDVTDRLAARVKLRFDSREMNAEKIKMVRSLCERNRGRSAIDIVVVTPHGRLAADADSKFNVNPNVAFCKGVKHLIGAENFKLCQK
ncbi:MAG: DNA polymerase III subunit alpha, partial [Phycisphaerae bacterium]|nr:DNA polymerase III subunit alpha [Phycisphaerae bacterium]